MFAQIFKGFLTGLGDDMKLIPHTSLSVLLLWIAAILTYQFAWPQVADTQTKVSQAEQGMQKLAASLDTVTKNLGKLNSRLVKEDMDRALADIEQETQALDREVATIQKRRGQVPATMVARHERLVILLQQKKRDLQAFIDSHPELMEFGL